MGDIRRITIYQDGVYLFVTLTDKEDKKQQPFCFVRCKDTLFATLLRREEDR